MENKPISINSINSIQKLTQLLRESSNDQVKSTEIQNRIEKLRLKNKKTTTKESEIDTEGTEKEITLKHAMALLKSKKPKLINIKKRLSPRTINISENNYMVDKYLNYVEPPPATETIILDIKQLLSMENDYDIIELKLVMRNKIKN
jgi:hypothetical protein